MAIHEHLPKIPKPDLKIVGCSKATELVKVARRDREEFDCATWLYKARTTQGRVQTGGGEAPDRPGNRAVGDHLFQGYKSQLPVIEQVLETAALLLGNDKSRGYCLEMICANFLAGANLESGGDDS